MSFIAAIEVGSHETILKITEVLSVENFRNRLHVRRRLISVLTMAGLYYRR